MPRKNDKITLSIIDMTTDGLGVAKEGRLVYFVKDAVIGDKVEANITKITEKLVYAKVTRVIEKSEYRVVPKCSVCDACGGCQVMPLSYEKQLDMKKNIVKNNLKRLAGLTDEKIEKAFLGIDGMTNPYEHRNKVQIPFAYKDGVIKTGFYAGRTHHIVENEGCIVSFSAAYRIIEEVKKYLSESDNITVYNELSGYGVFRELMLRQGNTSHEISVTFIVNDKKKDKARYMPLVKRLIKINSNIKTATLNINTESNNVLFGKENIVLYGDGYISDKMMGYEFHISPESFYQVNNVQTEKLYSTALDFVKDIDVGNALDLYCGIGTTTLILSKAVRHITGIEIVEKAIENAKENAKINNVLNADFVCADASNVKDVNIDTKDISLISVDPPRKGLDKSIIDFIKERAPKYVLYISCDPATLSRDIKLLSDAKEKVSYSIAKIKCIDMFPHTMHVETIVLFLKE